MMSERKQITEDELLEFGLRQKDSSVFPYQKKISEDGAAIVVSTMRNKAELALMLPNGDQIFLDPRNIEDLKAIEESFNGFEPNY